MPGAQTLEPGQCGAPVLIQIDEPVDDFDGLATASLGLADGVGVLAEHAGVKQGPRVRGPRRPCALSVAAVGRQMWRVAAGIVRPATRCRQCLATPPPAAAVSHLASVSSASTTESGRTT